VLKEGDAFGEETIVQHDLSMMRGYTAVAISHVLILALPGKDICDILDTPGNEFIRFQVRRQCFWWQCLRVCRRIVRTLKYAARLDWSLVEAREILEHEFGVKTMKEIPMLWEAWIRYRVQLKDPMIEAVRVMQRLFRGMRFRQGINAVVTEGSKRRAHDRLIRAARGLVRPLHLREEDHCCETFVKHHVDQGLLTSVPLMPTFFVLMGICVADAVVLAEHFQSVRGGQQADVQADDELDIATTCTNPSLHRHRASLMVQAFSGKS
jgi:CRP-like cAMP-binding protein